MPLISCKKLSKSFDLRPRILNEITLDIEPGDLIAIIGRSGEGKSTLLSILSGLLEPSSGDLLFENAQLLGNNPHTRRQMGFIFQSSFLLEDETVLDNILMPSYLKGLKPNSNEIKEIEEQLRSLGFAPSLTSKASILSGGEKQKVASLRALWNTPKILFADEPTGNLDGASSIELQDFLLERVKKMNAAFVLVTHDEKFAARCNHVYCLEGGKLLKKS